MNMIHRLHIFLFYTNVLAYSTVELNMSVRRSELILEIPKLHSYLNVLMAVLSACVRQSFGSLQAEQTFENRSEKL